MPNIFKETARGIAAVRLEDELFDNREIFLTDAINEQTSTDLLKQLMCLEKESDEEITLYINSPGGDVIGGLAVYDYISSMKSPIRTVCIGTAASMAAILFLAGDKREMFPHTQLIIHDPSFFHNDIGGQKPHEIKQQLDKLNEVRETLAKIISSKTNKSLDEIYAITANDTVFDANEAINFGLATAVWEG